MVENKGQLFPDGGKTRGIEVTWRGQWTGMPQIPVNRAVFDTAGIVVKSRLEEAYEGCRYNAFTFGKELEIKRSGARDGQVRASHPVAP